MLAWTSPWGIKGISESLDVEGLTWVLLRKRTCDMFVSSVRDIIKGDQIYRFRRQDSRALPVCACIITLSALPTYLVELHGKRLMNTSEYCTVLVSLP